MSSSDLNLAEHILDVLSKDKAKIVFACDSQTLSAEKTIELVRLRVSQLIAIGVRERSHVIIVTNRSYYFWIDLLAAWYIGAVIIPMESDIDEDRAYAIYTTSEAEYILGTLTRDIHWKIKRVCEVTAFEETLVEPVPFHYNPVAAILFTSGSTGAPKGVVLSPKALLHNVTEVLANISINCNDNLFIATGFHFTSAICHFLAAMCAGARFTCTEQKLLHKDLFTQLRKDEATCFGGSPLQTQWISECAAKEKISLKWVMSSGDNISFSTIQTFNNNLPRVKLYVVYGLTEVAGRLCILNPEEILKKRGSVGKPIRGMEIKVLDNNLNECAPGQMGEIYVTGEFIFDGYYGLSEEVITHYGFNTGDLGYRDEDGYVFLAGRRDLVFKCAGKKVSTFPISDEINKIQVFDDFVVIPIQHEFLGFVPAVIYSLNKNKLFKKGEVLAKLRRVLPSISIPRTFIQVDKIPRTGSGKPKYHLLRKLAHAYAIEDLL